jgi:hypothetical protein
MKAMVQGWRVLNAPAIYLSTAQPKRATPQTLDWRGHQYCYSAEGNRDASKFDATLKNTEMENVYRFPFRLVGRKSSKAATHLKQVKNIERCFRITHKNH